MKFYTLYCNDGTKHITQAPTLIGALNEFGLNTGSKELQYMKEGACFDYIWRPDINAWILKESKKALRVEKLKETYAKAQNSGEKSQKDLDHDQSFLSTIKAFKRWLSNRKGLTYLECQNLMYSFEDMIALYQWTIGNDQSQTTIPPTSSALEACREYDKQGPFGEDFKTGFVRGFTYGLESAKNYLKEKLCSFFEPTIKGD
jgi:hypothetical protein